ncbi:3-phosphoshikimate 1-carboxyvinyltransferase [Ekhidna sp.]|uniref:3-phosphoshikimate 1-carboxyvinyltransferase n=1 Tax=Ekhidna sp. TaxID=2608089 RepID=UPI003C79D8A9
MKNRLKRDNSRLKGAITLESSKSESNRALIINALAGGNVADIHNLSNARDTQTMRSLLQGKPDVYDVKDAGTTMRFLTAYLAIHGQGEIITGTDRMKNRPIGPLVDALRTIGAKIEYLEKDGYPPLKIHRIENQLTNKIAIPGNISSQYISALLMIVPSMEQGLEITLTSEIYSRPYIEMTLSLMKAFGVGNEWTGNSIKVSRQTYQPVEYTIEGDWSGASYWYSFISMAPEDSKLQLPTLRKDSTQGDIAIATIMNDLGVETQFEQNAVYLRKLPLNQKKLTIDFRSCPDLAQTVMVSAAVIGIELEMTGLESLKIKETDRIAAMQHELAKIGATLTENDKMWYLIPSDHLPDAVTIETYEDHRMAMAFAPLCLKMDVTIDDPSVVEKSYPGYWDEIKRLSIEIQESSNLPLNP